MSTSAAREDLGTSQVDPSISERIKTRHNIEALVSQDVILGALKLFETRIDMEDEQRGTEQITGILTTLDSKRYPVGNYKGMSSAELYARYAFLRSQASTLEYHPEAR
jgi:hypothetical protein